MPFNDPKKLAAWRKKNRPKLYAKAKQYRGKNAKRTLALTKRSHRLAMRAARRELATLLGGHCRDCKTTDERVFQFHHTGNDGFSDRGKNGGGNTAEYYRKLAAKVRIDRDYISLVCANCHAIRHWVTDDEIENVGAIPEPTGGRIVCQRL